MKLITYLRNLFYYRKQGITWRGCHYLAIYTMPEKKLNRRYK